MLLAGILQSSGGLRDHTPSQLHLTSLSGRRPFIYLSPSCLLRIPSGREDGKIPQDVLENGKRLKGARDCGNATDGTTKGDGRPGPRVGERDAALERHDSKVASGYTVERNKTIDHIFL